MRMVSGNEIKMTKDLVVKTSMDGSRAQLAGEMQQLFRSPYLKAPQVHRIKLSQRDYRRVTILMDRVHGNPVWETTTAWTSILLHLKHWLCYNEQQMSRNMWWPKVHTKICSLEEALIFPSDYPTFLREVVNKVRRGFGLDVPLPFGLPHGDFTTVNMLQATNGDVYVFDFLPTYLESPILDLSKLLQDVQYGWMVFTHGWVVTPPQRAEVLRQVKQYFGNMPWYPLVEHFTAMDLLRILPYTQRTSDTFTRNWVLDSLEEYLHNQQ